MRTFKLNKLVRDKIVQDHINAGGNIKFRRLNSEEKRKALANKIIEEANELKNSQETLEELADLQEILDQLAKDAGISRTQITNQQKKKRTKNGGFKNGDYIESETWPANHKWAKYYAAEPNRFPEVKQNLPRES